MTLLAAEGVCCMAGGREILASASLAVGSGELVGILGPNGAGKTTLLRAIGGLFAPAAGTVRLEGTPLATLARRDIARRLAFVPQVAQPPFAFPVRDFVSMGRMPHQGRFTPEGAADRVAVDAALRACALEPFAERPVTDLSGGEWQRVLLARALAQEPGLLLLDEPTAHLDVRHQVGILKLVRDWTAQGGRGAVAVLHDLNLAARYCTRIVLMDKGRILADGAPERTLTADSIRQTFGVEATVMKNPKTGSLEVTVTGVTCIMETP